jgi:hypothetical protein
MRSGTFPFFGFLFSLAERKKKTRTHKQHLVAAGKVTLDSIPRLCVHPQLLQIEIALELPPDLVVDLAALAQF